jgi:hypothetical protein
MVGSQELKAGSAVPVILDKMAGKAVTLELNSDMTH